MGRGAEGVQAACQPVDFCSGRGGGNRTEHSPDGRLIWTTQRSGEMGIDLQWYQ